VPELPDVEGFRRTFAKRATGKRVRAVQRIDTSMLRNTSPQGLARALKGRRFDSPERQGKLLICPADGVALLLHFGMTGSFVWCANGPLHYHDRLTLVFDDGELRYRNMRKFGASGSPTTSESSSRYEDGWDRTGSRSHASSSTGSWKGERRR
jgi:formamidopyrimidine-DNA glycosylase